MLYVVQHEEDLQALEIRSSWGRPQWSITWLLSVGLIGFIGHCLYSWQCSCCGLIKAHHPLLAKFLTWPWPWWFASCFDYHSYDVFCLLECRAWTPPTITASEFVTTFANGSWWYSSPSSFVPLQKRIVTMPSSPYRSFHQCWSDASTCRKRNSVAPSCIPF